LKAGDWPLPACWLASESAGERRSRLFFAFPKCALMTQLLLWSLCIPNNSRRGLRILPHDPHLNTSPPPNVRS
jgi:hypothetical protein